MKPTAKEFALAQLAPYYKDPSTCGITERGTCQYLTDDGKMCIAGKNLTKKALKACSKLPTSIESLIKENGQDIFIPKSRNVLTQDQWGHLQVIHDAIAKNDVRNVKKRIEQMKLFLFEDLEKYADDLK